MIGKVLSFYLGGSLLGIDVTLIKEINRNIDYTPVPDAKAHIIGLFNMRGQVVTLFNLAKLIGLDEENKMKTSCIILKSPRDPNQIGFFIDRPGDVIDIEKEKCESPPANIGCLEGEFLTGVMKLKDELLMIIDPGRIFNDQLASRE